MQTEEKRAPEVCLAAVGDLLPAGLPDTSLAERAQRRLADVSELLAASHVALANLEATLEGDGGRVPTEPQVVTAPAMIQAAIDAGFGVVSLANNHMFDALDGGFRHMRRLLRDLEVPAFGAGEDLAEAASPAIVACRGLRLAFLGAADRRSGAPFFAGTGRWGVAAWDPDRIEQQVRDLSSEVHHVIVCPHWGEERFSIPAPQQIRDARRMVDAGASLVIGHHPHVLQGTERYGRGVIAYSLGNFVAGYVGFADGDTMAWRRRERIGCVLRVRLSATEVLDVEQIPTYDDGQCVREERCGFGRRRLRTVNRRLARGVTARRYRREHLRVKTLRPIFQHLRWSRLRRVRWRSIRKAWQRLSEARAAE